MISSANLAALARRHASGSNSARTEAGRLRTATAPGSRQRIFLTQLHTAGRDVPASLLPAVAEAIVHEQPDLSEAEALAAAHDLLSGVVEGDPWLEKGLPRTFEDIMSNSASRGRLMYEAQHGPPETRQRARTLLADFKAAWRALEAEEAANPTPTNTVTETER